MKIVMVCPDAPPNPNGGLGTYLEGLLGAVEGLGLDVEIDLVGTSRDPSLPRLSQEGGVRIHRLFAPRPWADRSIPRRLVGLAREYLWLNGAALKLALARRPDLDLLVVHDWMCAPAGLVGRILQIPVAYHVHSAEIYLGEGRRGAVSGLGRALTKLMSSVANGIIVPTRATADLIPYLAERTDVRAIPHGAGKAYRIVAPTGSARLEVRDRIRARHGIAAEQQLIVFAGRLAPHKGVAEMVEALRLVVDRGHDVAMIVVGSGLPDVTIDDRLEQQAAALELSDRVILLRKFVETDEMVEYLAAADACCFPSSHEAYGFIALEAMAVGVRSVVGPGFADDVVGRFRGTCVHTRTIDPVELADAYELVLDPTQQPDMAQIAQEFALHEHNWESAARNTIEAYREIVRG